MSSIGAALEVEREPEGRFIPIGDTRILFGAGSAQRIGEDLRDFGVKRALVIVGRSLGRGRDVLPRLLEALQDFDPVVFEGAARHSPIDRVEATAEAVREAKADVLISLGGGSAVDVAKGASMVLTGQPLETFSRRAKKANERPVDSFYRVQGYPCPPVVGVCTTLSGAEFTGQAGLTWPDRNEKDQFYHRPSAPRLVVLDRTLTTETPDRLWHSSGMKCLDHCIERLYSVHRQPVCDALSTAAARVVLDRLGTESDRPDNPARTELLIGAWMAQMSTGNVNVALDHAIGHQLGALAGIGHGEAAAVTMPHVMRFNAKNSPEAAAALARLARESRSCPDDATESEAVDAIVRRVEELVKRLGLPSRLRDLDVDPAILPEIARRSIDDTAITGNPRVIKDDREILKLLEAAW